MLEPPQGCRLCVRLTVRCSRKCLRSAGKGRAASHAMAMGQGGPSRPVVIAVWATTATPGGRMIACFRRSYLRIFPLPEDGAARPSQRKFTYLIEKDQKPGQPLLVSSLG